MSFQGYFRKFILISFFLLKNKRFINKGKIIQTVCANLSSCLSPTRTFPSSFFCVYLYIYSICLPVYICLFQCFYFTFLWLPCYLWISHTNLYHLLFVPVCLSAVSVICSSETSWFVRYQILHNKRNTSAATLIIFITNVSAKKINK